MDLAQDMFRNISPTEFPRMHTFRRLHRCCGFLRYISILCPASNFPRTTDDDDVCRRPFITLLPPLRLLLISVHLKAAAKGRVVLVALFIFDHQTFSAILYLRHHHSFCPCSHSRARIRTPARHRTLCRWVFDETILWMWSKYIHFEVCVVLWMKCQLLNSLYIPENPSNPPKRPARHIAGRM